MAMDPLPEYIWRGKSYKTISGFMKAVDRALPNQRISFLTHAVSIRRRDGSITLLARRFDENGNSVIADL